MVSLAVLLDVAWKLGHNIFINVATWQLSVLLAHSLVERLWLDCDKPDQRVNITAETVTLFLLLLKWICVVDAKSIFHSAGEASCRGTNTEERWHQTLITNRKGRLSVVDVLSGFFLYVYIIGSL